MLRFPVEWIIPERDERARISKLKLNEVWTLVAIWSALGTEFYRPQAIKIRRKTTSEEIKISGKFSLQQNNRTVSSREKFSKLMKSESSFMKLVHIGLHPTTTVIGPAHVYLLLGIVNITSVSKKCSKDFESGNYKSNVLPKSLSKDLECFLDPQTYRFADVNLKCGISSIPAHKNILSARSPVFAAMFINPMKENAENEVNVRDVDASVMRAMLTFIYTGRTADLTVASALDLLLAADKFQLQDLRSVCCNFLKDTISLGNL